MGKTPINNVNDVVGSEGSDFSYHYHSVEVGSITTSNSGTNLQSHITFIDDIHNGSFIFHAEGDYDNHINSSNDTQKNPHYVDQQRGQTQQSVIDGIDQYYQELMKSQTSYTSNKNHSGYNDNSTSTFSSSDGTVYSVYSTRDHSSSNGQTSNYVYVNDVKFTKGGTDFHFHYNSSVNDADILTST